MAGGNSQDPISYAAAYGGGLAGGNPTLYGYVVDPNAWIDVFGLYSDLLPTGMGHHLVPRSIAKKLAIPELSGKQAIAWYPNKAADTTELHKRHHRELIKAGVPYHGSRFTGTVDEFFTAAKKAYKDIDVPGFMKIPFTKNKLMKNVIPLQALEKLEKLHEANKIPCSG